MVMQKTELVDDPQRLELMCRHGKVPMTKSMGLLIHLGFVPSGNTCDTTHGLAQEWCRQHSVDAARDRQGQARKAIILWRAMLVSEAAEP
jgi:hypothetical protein